MALVVSLKSRVFFISVNPLVYFATAQKTQVPSFPKCRNLQCMWFNQRTSTLLTGMEIKMAVQYIKLF